MKPIRHFLVLALLASACTRPDPSVSFGAICLPPEADTCTFESTCTTGYIGTFELDVARNTRLWVVVEVNNRHPDNEVTEVGQINTGDAHLEEILVAYEGAVALNPLRYKTQATVPAGGTTVVSLFPLLNLPAATMTAGTSAVVVAKVKAKGTFNDGGTFETAEIDIPVLLCNGCYRPPLPCAAGDVQFTCPPDSFGQVPITTTCVTPP